MTHLHVEHITSQDGKSLIYRLRGVLGESTYSYDFSDDMRKSVKDGPEKVILNLEKLEYITSAGVGVIAAGFTSAQRADERRTMVGSGDRSQRVRTYNYPQNRVSDHRINLDLYSLDKIMQGELDPLIEALQTHDKQQRLKNL